MIPLGILGGDKSLARKRDVAKAKQLLTEAGFPNGIELKLSYWTAPLLGVATEPLAAKLQADLAQAGIKITLDPKERSVSLAEYRAGKPQLMLASWSPDFLDPDPYADAFYGAGPVPKRVKYSNPKVTDIIATAKKEQDPKKREALYMEMNKIALEDVSTIMLIQPKNFVGLNPAIKGYAIHPIWWVTVANLSR
jgi:peptide/nickel transport system substrate-binding protein